MNKTKWLIILFILTFGLTACSSSSDKGETPVEAVDYHEVGWGEIGHQSSAVSSLDTCRSCHGDDFFGGSSGVDCYNCHFGPTGGYVPSEIAVIRGIAPVTDESDGSGSPVVTSSLPNAAVNSYIYLQVNASEVDDTAAVAWSLSAAPPGSASAITQINSENIKFFADTKGFYTVTVTAARNGEAVSEEVVIYANAYTGAAACATCHSGEYDDYMTTGHATVGDALIEGYFTGAVGNLAAECFYCHTTGYDPAGNAENGGFDDAADEAGFTIDSLASLDDFDDFKAAYPTVNALLNVQCENCHGPGEEHKGVSSLSESVCGQCHDSGGGAIHSYQIKTYQWRLSAHSDYDSAAFTTPVGDEHAQCAACHSGAGFIDNANGVASESLRTGTQPVTCAVCHDPHKGGGGHQLRAVSDITLAGGEVISGGGDGRLCMNCHRSPVDAESYAAQYHESYGAHYSPQAEMLFGAGGIEYGEEIASSPHISAVTDSCVGCHMASPNVSALFDDDAKAYKAGGHTFNMSYDALENTAVCQSCHSGLTQFNITAQADYDGDGAVEGVQDEVKGLLEVLAIKLPPQDDPAVTVTADYTEAELKAAYNYTFVERDKSLGIHNFGYAVDLLQTTYRNLTGADIPGGDIY